MKKTKIVKGFMIALALVLTIATGGTYKASAQELCCDNMRKVTTYIGSYYDYSSHTFNCSTHQVVHYCTITYKHSIYNRTCTNCGTDWGNYETVTTTHSVSDCPYR